MIDNPQDKLVKYKKSKTDSDEPSINCVVTSAKNWKQILIID